MCLIVLMVRAGYPFFFFFNDTATTEIYTLSLHDALPICSEKARPPPEHRGLRRSLRKEACGLRKQDRKSTRLNSSHGYISYAVFCLKKKKSYQAEAPPISLMSPSSAALTSSRLPPSPTGY